MCLVCTVWVPPVLQGGCVAERRLVQVCTKTKLKSRSKSGTEYSKSYLSRGLKKIQIKEQFEVACFYTMSETGTKITIFDLK